jgi:hypothetical protein
MQSSVLQAGFVGRPLFRARRAAHEARDQIEVPACAYVALIVDAIERVAGRLRRPALV